MKTLRRNQQDGKLFKAFGMGLFLTFVCWVIVTGMFELTEAVSIENIGGFEEYLEMVDTYGESAINFFFVMAFGALILKGIIKYVTLWVMTFIFLSVMCWIKKCDTSVRDRILITWPASLIYFFLLAAYWSRPISIMEQLIILIASILYGIGWTFEKHKKVKPVDGDVGLSGSMEGIQI